MTYDTIEDLDRIYGGLDGLLNNELELYFLTISE